MKSRQKNGPGSWSRETEVGEKIAVTSIDPLKYGFLKKLFHYDCTSYQLNISSHQNYIQYITACY